MKKLFLLMLILYTCSTSVLYAQSKKLKDLASYKSALISAKPMEKAVVDKDFILAEKLFLQSLDIYPVWAIVYDDFINAKVNIGDIKGANLLWEKAIAIYKKHDQILVYNPPLFSTFNIAKGSDYDYVPSSEKIKSIYLDRAYANATHGDINQTVKDYLTVESSIGLNTENYNFLAVYATQAGDFETARRSVDTLKKVYANGKRKLMDAQLQPVYTEAFLLLAMGEYAKALPLAERLDNEDKGLNTTWKGFARMMKAEAYAGLGDLENAQKALEHALKHPVFGKNTVNVQYTTGLVALLAKDYVKAADAFTKEINHKGAWGKHRFYTRRAEAHIGLKDYIKAKSDYETALLYHPSYEPAILGLANLEGRAIAVRKTDKTPPTIKLTEPSNARGLKITASSNDMMVKGVASDLSGIKSVSINGQPVFSKEQGDFWGSVSLKDGINKVTVKAIDIAGNIAEQIFEIEKQNTPVAVNDEILPVATVEAKNYALIIAAQNYEDSSIPSLENPVSDAIKLKLIIKNNYSFADDNIYTLFNPGVNDFKKKFAEMLEVIRPDDNLIIFYAGHGIWVEKEKKGYWLLTDAKRNDINTWLSNKLVLEMISKIPSRHTLLITDACFSGSVFKTRSIGAGAPAAIREMSEKISRVAITSGNDTEVPDQSVFMKYLVKALSENKEKYLTAQKMFINQIIEAVMTETKTEPRYGTLEAAGHVGGDYIFMKK
ncbi:caspase family protein [Solitalea lacus]|uniref:caspase family protein n=1 Tax=Solitalea lacus TaxID=2911172 RepID=UPI001EDC745D|nr:caspase family protein [Solitalea lacus]UKJ08816.1 tetratricopeptide repeat protein [Solitalea lacus]